VADGLNGREGVLSLRSSSLIRRIGLTEFLA